jgi:pantoate--beta-alanine ligase
MQTVTTIAEARALLDSARSRGDRIGLVPTMGYLHDGHVSLMEAARRNADVVMTTIFVNPLQFAPDEDLAAYPRDLERDRVRCADAGVDVLLVPSVEEMYPQPISTTVTVADVAAPFEGESRPTHFAGVATVVAKLFNIAGACHAYFGEKDWQQLRVIATIAADLSFPVTVVGCPIVREPDGLAMSSRNAYLEPAERIAARVLSQALQAAVDAVAAGEQRAERIRALLGETIGAEELARLDYVAVADGATLQPVETVDAATRLLVSASIGRARLIDNCAAHGPGPLSL